MKSLFEEMGGTYRQEGDYLIPNLALPDEPEYQIGKYGRMRRNYLKEHRPVLYASLLTSGTLHRHLAEIDQACNERMAIIVSDMARQEDVTEALKAADQMEWVRRMNSILLLYQPTLASSRAAFFFSASFCSPGGSRHLCPWFAAALHIPPYCSDDCRYAAQIKRQGARKKALREAKNEKETKTA